MTAKTEKKDTVGSWLLSVALWMALILFASNQGMQVVAKHEDKHYTVRYADDVLCAVAINGERQTMRCFREENEE